MAYEFGPQVALDLDSSIARGPKFSKAQAKEIVDYGRSLGIEPIGYLNMLGHLERAYQKPPYTDHGGLMIQNQATYDEFVFPILSEMLGVYGPIEYFHCGMDEAWGLFEWLAEQGHDPAKLIAQHVAKVHELLKSRGIKLVIWHDMFVARSLQEKLGAPIGPANGGPPRNTARALESLPKDVILNYWFYDSLPKYPAMEYLKEKGFEVWASPWKTPFALTRYAQARDVPTLGTMWSGPPSCFYSQTYNCVTAYYAAASWNPGAAPASVNPEVEIAPAAGEATAQALWTRRRLTFPTDAARAIPGLKPLGYSHLVLSGPGIAPHDLMRLPWVDWPCADDSVEQHYGVPFDFSAPAVVPPLEGDQQSLERVEEASYVLLRDGEEVTLDGVNQGRATDELVLYAAPRTATGTNVFGVEVVVSGGRVVEVRENAGSSAIPADGYVLSAHRGETGANVAALRKLKPGAAAPLRIVKGHREYDPDEALKDRSWQSPVNARCDALYFATAAEASGSPGTVLGAYRVAYADGSVEEVPVKYAQQALTVEGSGRGVSCVGCDLRHTQRRRARPVVTGTHVRAAPRRIKLQLCRP